MLLCQVNACGQGIKTNSPANALCPVEMEGLDNSILYRHLGVAKCLIRGGLCVRMPMARALLHHLQLLTTSTGTISFKSSATIFSDTIS